MKKRNIGILYAGEHVHRNILPVLIESNKFNLCGIYIRSKKNYNQNYKNFYKSKSQILNDPSIDTIYISSPNSRHTENISEVLKKKKHVICEKPLYLNLEDYKKIKNLSIKNNKVIFEGFMFIYHDLFNYIMNTINKKSKQIETITAKFMIPHLNPSNIRYKKKLGGGSYYDCGCYLYKFLSSFISYNEKINRQTNFYFSKKFNVDTHGFTKIKFKNIYINLEWGFGYKYENYVKIVFKNFQLLSKRFFSKNSLEKSSIIKFNKKTKKIKKIIFKKQNHFNSMLIFFHKIINSKKKREKYIRELENHQNIYLEKIPY